MDPPGSFHTLATPTCEACIYPRQRYASQGSWLLCYRLLPVATTAAVIFLFHSSSRASRPLPTLSLIGIVPFLLFMVMRMLVMGAYGGLSFLLFALPLISMSILGVVVMKRRKPRHRIDAAGLALLLEAAAPSSSESSSLLIYPNQIGRGKAQEVSRTGGETYLGFVGPRPS